MIVIVAYMHGLKWGEISLRDATGVQQFCLEPRDLEVLRAAGSLVAKNQKITLRMLLAHTSLLKLVNHLTIVHQRWKHKKMNVGKRDIDAQERYISIDTPLYALYRTSWQIHKNRSLCGMIEKEVLQG